MPTITVDNVSKYYRVKRRDRQKNRYGRRNRIEVGVENVSLTIEQGEFVFFIGSRGAGKSTLLNLIAGRDKPSKGNVLINGKRLFGDKSCLNRRLSLLIGYVSQQSTLDRAITIRANLELAAKAGNRKFEDEYNFDERANKVLGLVGLPDVGGKYPIELTAGECRRVELACALINSPPILVLDEVTASLDEDSLWDMFLLLHEINRLGTTVIMATRSSQYVNMLRRRVVMLVDGRVYSDVSKGRYGETGKKQDLPIRL